MTIHTPLSDEGKITLSDALIEARAERARRSFAYFVRLIRPEYDIQWVHDTMMAALQESGTARQDTRLGMALPAGHAKTEYCLLFMVWMCVRDPDVWIKYVTYSALKAKDSFRRLKEILRDERVIGYFGKLVRASNKRDNDAVNSSELVTLVQGRGFIHATGFGGNITGSRCDIIVIDDPFKNFQEASSLATRNARWNSYGSDIKTRRREGRPFRILMLFTRWHLDDLVGRCKAQEPDDWKWIEIEAIREQIDHPDDPRKDGEILWPSQLPLEQALKERSTRPEIFIAMYQQRPMPASGRIFLRDWFPSWDVIPAQRGQWIQSWDFRAGGIRQSGSFAVAILAFKPEGEEKIYIVDVIRGRWSPEESLEEFRARQRKTEQATTGIAAKWANAAVRLVEKKADGIMILSLESGKHKGLIPITPRVDKETRARAVSPFARAGQVVLPLRARWLAAFLEEVCNFPAADSDDQVDALSQLLDYVFGATDTANDVGAASDTWAALMGKRKA